jgi:hypothetical protein
VVSFAHYTLSVFFSEKWLCRFMLSMRFSKFCYLVKERLKKEKREGAEMVTSPTGRLTLKSVCVLESYYLPFNQSTVEKVIYDTGTAKRGISLLLGGE